MLKAEDIYHYRTKLEGALRRIASDPNLRPADKKLLADYITHCEAQGLSVGRRFKQAWQMLSIARQMPCSFKAAKRKDIERLVSWINSAEKYKPNTKSDLKKNLKQFYKFVRYGNVDRKTPYPPEVAWIPTVIKRNEVREEPVITESEAKNMVEVATSSRNKAFIAVGYEGGFRIGELLLMTVGNATFVDKGVRLKVAGGVGDKTGPREVLLVASAPVLATYLDSHPFKSDPESALWLGIEGPNKDKPLKYSAASHILKETARLAKVKKRIHPNLFRTSAATRDSELGFTDRFLETKFGWTRGSRMAAHYSRAFDKKALDDKTLEVYGGKEAPKREATFRPNVCPRCKADCSPGQTFCARCGTPLDMREVVKSETELSEVKKSVDALGSIVKEQGDILVRIAERERRLPSEVIRKRIQEEQDALEAEAQQEDEIESQNPSAKRSKPKSR